jgi:serine/threonine-protein kinase
VKVLPAALAADPNYVTRFRTEARRVAQLRHPNIVEVYAFNGGDRGDLLYLVMPVLTESLRDRLDDEGNLSVRESVRIVTEIASGLEVAHGGGLVHRDVKPENILLDRDGHALLTDFGIAREVPSFHRQGNAAQTLAATGLPVGTPEYMAPEQLRGGPVDQRADIYALGSVLYELLTGRVPHEADTPYEVAALVLTEPVVPPSRRNEDIPPALEQVVMKALAKVPTQRYPDVRSFALALNAAVRSGRATMRTLAGGWQRKTVRFSTSHGGVERWTAGATTESFAVVGQPASRGFASRYRWMLILVASAILLASVCGGGTLMALNGGLPFGGTSPASLSALSATQTARAAAIPTATPIPTETPTPVPTATPQPTATTPPPPTWLTFTPSTLVLARQGSACSGTLTISNTSKQTLGWQWTAATPSLSGSYYRVYYNGKQYYGETLPQNMTPGLKQGETDTILVYLYSCASHQSQVNVTAKDSLNHSYHFVIQPS